MKNKWLIGLLSGALAATLCFGLVACAPKEEEKKSDADLAQAAINTVKVLYEKDTSTPKDYTVIGQTKVGDNMYPIAWSVSSDVSDINNYVKIGTMDQSTKLVTIGITQGEQDVSYTLKASVTVGEATETAEFAKKIPAKAVVNNDGSAEHPFTVTDAMAIGESLANGEFYQVGGKNARVHIKGLVVNPGNFKEASGSYPDELERVFIADDVDAEEADQVKIQYILFNNVMAKPANKTSPLGKGDEIVVWGFIERFNDATTIYYAKEEEDGETKYPEVTSWKKAEKTDADKVAEAKAALKIGETEYRVEGTFDVLPASQGDATITWALKAASDAVEVDSGKLKVKSLPDTDAKATLVATLTCGEATDTKDFEITVGKAETPEHAGTASDPYTVADLFKVTKTIVGNSYLGGKDAPTQIYAKGIVVKVDGWGAQYSNWTGVYIADTLDATSADQVQVYRLGLDDTYLKAQKDLVVGAEITLCGYLQKYSGKPEVSNSGNTNVKAVEYTKPDEPVKVKGSAENPYTVAEAIEIINELDENGFYGDPVKEVYVKGVVVKASSLNSFTIGATKDATETVTVYGATLNTEGTFTKAGDLFVGSEITVSGALQKYGSGSKTTPEVASKDTIKVKVVSYTDVRTDAEKATAAKNAVLMPERVDENLELPEANITGVTLEWAIFESSAAKLASDKKAVEVTRGAADVEFTLTLTVKCGSETQTKAFTVKVKAVLTAGEHTGTLDFTSDFDTYYAADWTNSYVEHVVKMADVSDSGIKGTVTLSRASRQTSTITDRPTLAAQKEKPAQITVYADGLSLKSVIFTMQEWTNKKKFSKIYLETSTDGSEWTAYGTALGDGKSNTLLISDHGTFTFTATDTTVKYVRLTLEAIGTSNVQVGLSSIDLTVTAAASEGSGTSVTIPEAARGTFTCMGGMKNGEDVDPSDVPALVVTENSIKWGDKAVTILEGANYNFRVQIDGKEYGLMYDVGGWSLGVYDEEGEPSEVYMFVNMAGGGAGGGVGPELGL